MRSLKRCYVNEVYAINLACNFWISLQHVLYSVFPAGLFEVFTAVLLKMEVLAFPVSNCESVFHVVGQSLLIPQ
jgi:hypothetical protein